MKTTKIEELLGVGNDNSVYCVKEKIENNDFIVVVFQPISKKELWYLNSSNYINFFIISLYRFWLCIYLKFFISSFLICQKPIQEKVAGMKPNTDFLEIPSNTF